MLAPTAIDKIDGRRLPAFFRRALMYATLIVGIGAAFAVHTPVLAATLQVSPSGTDVGNCTALACRTITYAISAAHDTDTIMVAAGNYVESDITINKSLTISGAGAASTNVFPPDRGLSPPGRIFLVAAGTTVAINGLTIKDGYEGAGTNGGGILNYGALTLTGDVISRNRVNAVQTPQIRAFGAGIYNALNATLTLTSTTVSGNIAGTSVILSSIDPSCGGEGGGIATAGTLIVSNSTISANSAVSLNTCGADEAWGGGILIMNTGVTVSISQSTIMGNSADSYGAAIATYILATGNIGTLTLDHTTVSDHLTNSLNKALQYPIFEIAQMNLIMTFATITNNNGGAVEHRTNNYNVCLTISDSTISNNTASNSFAGGLQGGGGECGVTITRSAISGNRSQYTVPGTTTIYSLQTGGIEVSGTLTITDSQITGNSGHDGGVVAHSDALTVTRSVVSNNTALRDGVGQFSSVGVGGINAQVYRLIIVDSTVGNNTTTGDGGGILSDTHDTTITGSTISSNSANHGSGLLLRDYSYAGTISVTNSTVSGNTGGSAIENLYSSAVTLTNTTVANNATGVANPGSSTPNYPGTLTVRNSILMNTGPNCAIGSITSGGYNVVSDVSCGFTAGGTDLISVNPKIGPLANNGGPTRTHALNSGSPAIDAIPAAGGCRFGITADQRGTARPFGAGCDIGAYELKVDAAPQGRPGVPPPPGAPPPVVAPPKRPGMPPPAGAPLPNPAPTGR